MVSTRRSVRGQPDAAAEAPAAAAAVAPANGTKRKGSAQAAAPETAAAAVDGQQANPQPTPQQKKSPGHPASASKGAAGSPPSAKRRREQTRSPKDHHEAAANGTTVAAAANGTSEAGEGGDVLDGFHKLPKLRAALEALQSRVDDSAVFLRPSPEVAGAAREAAKLLYQQCARVLLEGGGPGGGSRAERRALRNSSAAPLPELHTDASFDPEQIWLQLELATEAAVRRVRRLIRVADPLAAAGDAAGAGLLTAEAAAGIDRLLSGSGSDDEDENEEDEEMEDDDEPGSSDLLGEGEEEDEEDEDMDEGEEDDGEGRGRRAKKARKDEGGKAASKKQPPPPGSGPRIEDRFFRLSDLEKYVEDAERRAMAGDDKEEDLLGLGRGGDGEEGEEEEEDGGLFGAMDSDDEEAAMERLLKNAAATAGKKKGGKDGGKDAAQIRYKDFFGGGGGGGDDEDEDDEDEDDEDEEDEEDEDEEEGPPGRAGRRGGLLSSEEGEMDEDEEEEEEDEEEDGGAARRRSGKDAGPRDGAAVAGRPGSKAAGKAGKDKGAQQQQQAAIMSSHERRLARLQERVAELEADALADKAWHLTGEVTGGSRPMNSALELDLDFESTAKPAPVQTDEMTNDLEALIRKRIADHRFDDVVRVVPPPLETKKKEVELDDSKSKAGLGELYEQDYVRQVTGGTAEDKDEKLRAEARALFKALCGKLDALCRFHFAPKPVVEEMTIRSEVPAIAMEEAAPVAVSKAAMQLPGEVYQPGSKDGRPLAEGELTKDERKQRRARKKRQHKARVESKEAERRAVAAGGTAEVVGRKSDSKVVSGKGVKVAEGAGASRHGRTDLGNSSAVFAKLAAEQKAAAAGGGAAAAGKVARELKMAGAGGQGAGGKKGANALKL